MSRFRPTRFAPADRRAAWTRTRAMLLAWRLELLAAAPAWADHPIDGATSRLSPLATALLFGGVTLVLGLVVIAVVRALFSDRSRES